MTSNPRPPLTLTLQRANQLIKAMDAMTKYLVSLPDDQERLVSMRSQPLSPNAGEGLGGEGDVSLLNQSSKRGSG